MADILRRGLVTIDTTLETVAKVADEVALDYGCGGTREQEIVSQAFEDFANKLRSFLP